MICSFCCPSCRKIDKLQRSALIVPEGFAPEDDIDLDEYWVGKIKDVRCLEDNPLEVSETACHVAKFYSNVQSLRSGQR